MGYFRNLNKCGESVGKACECSLFCRCYCHRQSLCSWPLLRCSPSLRPLSTCPGRSRQMTLPEERLWGMTSVWFLNSHLHSLLRWCSHRYCYFLLTSFQNWIMSSFAHFLSLQIIVAEFSLIHCLNGASSSYCNVICTKLFYLRN